MKSKPFDVRRPAADSEFPKDASLEDKYELLSKKAAAENNSREQTTDKLQLNTRRDEALRTVIDVLNRAKMKPNPSKLVGELPSYLDRFDTRAFRYGVWPVEGQASLDSVSGPIFYESYDEICSTKLISGSRPRVLTLGAAFNYLEARCLSKATGAVARRFRVSFDDNHEVKNVKSIEEGDLLYKDE